jgi:hypothetical protein
MARLSEKRRNMCKNKIKTELLVRNTSNEVLLGKDLVARAVPRTSRVGGTDVEAPG